MTRLSKNSAQIKSSSKEILHSVLPHTPDLSAIDYHEIKYVGWDTAFDRILR